MYSNTRERGQPRKRDESDLICAARPFECGDAYSEGTERQRVCGGVRRHRGAEDERGNCHRERAAAQRLPGRYSGPPGQPVDRNCSSRHGGDMERLR